MNGVDDNDDNDADIDGVVATGPAGTRGYPIDGDGVDGTGSAGDRCYPIDG